MVKPQKENHSNILRGLIFPRREFIHPLKKRGKFDVYTLNLIFTDWREKHHSYYTFNLISFTLFAGETECAAWYFSSQFLNYSSPSRKNCRRDGVCRCCWTQEDWSFSVVPFLTWSSPSRNTEHLERFSLTLFQSLSFWPNRHPPPTSNPSKKFQTSSFLCCWGYHTHRTWSPLGSYDERHSCLRFVFSASPPSSCCDAYFSLLNINKETRV